MRKYLKFIFLFMSLIAFTGCAGSQSIVVPKTFNQVYAEIDGIEATALDVVNKSSVPDSLYKYVHDECKKIDSAKKAARAVYHAGDGLDGINKVLVEASELLKYTNSKVTVK